MWNTIRKFLTQLLTGILQNTWSLWKKILLLFIYPLLLSLISAIIFFYFFTILPEQRDFDKIKPQIEIITDRIISNGMFLVTIMTHENVSQKKYYCGSLSSQEVKEALKGVFYETGLKYSVVNMNKGECYIIGDYVNDQLVEINKDIELLLRYIIFIDPELVSIVSELQINDLKDQFKHENSSKIIECGELSFSLEKTDLSRYSNSLFKYYLTLMKLEEYLDRNFYSELKSLRMKAERAYFYTEDYELAIKYFSKILKIKEEDRTAIFYLGASYIKDNQIDRGVDHLKQALLLYPDLDGTIRSNIANEEAVEKIFN